jgi:integrase
MPIALDYSWRCAPVSRGEARATDQHQNTANDCQRQSRTLDVATYAECRSTRGWILRSPFAAGDSLISLADENKRERIFTHEEELKLLAACDAPQRGHLKAILICALDTGMHQGEIFSLRWRDVDLEERLLNIQAFRTKTMKERHVAITTRLVVELERLKATAPDDPDVLVFGILDNVNAVSLRREGKPG